MIFHHYIKIIFINLIVSIGIDYSAGMEVIETDPAVGETGSVKVEIFPDSGIKQHVYSGVINSLHSDSLQKNKHKDDINLNEEVPGCADNYFRCCILHWRITKGWYSFGSLLTGSFGAGILIPAIFDIAPEYRRTLEITSAVLMSTSTLLQAIKVFGIQQIQEHQADLQEIIAENHAEKYPVYRLKAVRNIKD